MIWLLLPSMAELYNTDKLGKIGRGTLTNTLARDLSEYLEEQKSKNPQYYEECMLKLKLPILTTEGSCNIGLACGCVPLEAPGSIYNPTRKTFEILWLLSPPFCCAVFPFMCCMSPEAKALKASLDTQSGRMYVVLHLDGHIEIDGIPFSIDGSS